MAKRWLISDLDGVIRHWDQKAFAACAQRFGMTARQLAAVAFEPDLLAAAMRGELTATAWYAEIERGCQGGTNPGTPRDVAGLAEAFGQLGWTIDRAVVDTLAEVRAGGTPVALFSNASTRLEVDLEASGLQGAFDVVINSSRLGQIKPEVAAFMAAARLLDTEPAACWFIDDQPVNVAGAIEAGMDAVVFEGNEPLRRWLAARDLLAGTSPDDGPETDLAP